MDPQQNPNPAQPKVDNPLAVMQPGETIICEIRRHPIGVIGTYFGAGFFVILLFAAAIFGLRYLGNGASQYTGVGLIIAVLTSVLVLIYAYVATIIYNANRWIVTSDSVTQVTQVGLFSKQSSQLSMANLEDITAEQNGILAHMFNFGMIKAETAGERSKFVLLYCPNPNYYAQQILNAREIFEQDRKANGTVPPLNVTTRN